jgi:hypothetical protein
MLDPFALERSIEDVLAGRLRVVLGGKAFILPVRSIASNRRWVDSLDAKLSSLLATVSTSGDYATLVGAVESIEPENLLDLVIAYDEDGVLPARDELLELARPHELLQALKAIRRVQNPLADVGLVAAFGASAGTPSPASTSSPHRNGASGRRKSSSRA